jgi:hypothetical protein
MVQELQQYTIFFKEIQLFNIMQLLSNKHYNY